MPAGQIAHDGGNEDSQRRPFDIDPARQDGSGQNGDIGACFDEPGPGQDFLRLEMLRQNCILDRAEEGRMHTHGEQREQHQRDRHALDGLLLPGEHQSRPADQHDEDFAELDDADDLGLVAHVGKLSGERGKQEKRQDEQT